jgi:4-alpha-glucanotransferase
VSTYLFPIFEASSNHGYDTNEYYTVRQIFGNDALFDALIAGANNRGMRVILDGVYNHAGSDSKYMDGYGLNRWPSDTGACESAASPYRSWFTPAAWFRLCGLEMEGLVYETIRNDRE